MHKKGTAMKSDVIGTYTGAEVIGTEHHTVMMEARLRCESTDFLAYRLERSKAGALQAAS